MPEGRRRRSARRSRAGIGPGLFWALLLFGALFGMHAVDAAVRIVTDDILAAER